MGSPHGTLFIVSAPSGGGKTSLVRALVEHDPALEVCVSHTTRPRRAGEVDGVDYHFVDDAAFQAMVAQGQFLEHARVFDNHYGTAQRSVSALLAQGSDVILEIDWQGARQIRQSATDAVSVFIVPPSRVELERRLRGRGLDSPGVIAGRMHAAEQEMAHYREYQWLVVNDDFERARADLAAVIHAQRLRCDSQAQRWRAVLDELLGER